MSTPTISRSMNNNLTTVYTDKLTLWFSYETVVAFETAKTGRVVSENVWSNTTGRHLASIDGGGPASKKTRVPHREFEKMLAKVR